MSAMPNTTDPDRFDLLEMDSPAASTTTTSAPDESDFAVRASLLELDGITPAQQLAIEGDVSPEVVAELDAELSQAGDQHAAARAEFAGIAAEASANAATQAGEFGSIRRVTAENAVAGVTSGAKNAEFDNRGIVHRPRASAVALFDRPVAERRFIVGPEAQQVQEEILRPGKLEAGRVVAGAVAEGHGVLVGWHGDRQITRAVLLEALRGIGREDWAPKPKDARAQAGRAMAAAGSSYHVKADRKGAVTRHEGGNTSGQHRWRLGQIDTMGRPGDAYGTTVLVMTLEPDGRLHGAGSQQLAQTIIDDYTARCAQELYTSADLTQWLAGQLMGKCGAISYAVGWYIPARYRAAAIELCNAVSATGWGCDWLGSKERPALPIATCDELRDGIAKGLKDEIAQVLHQLHTEREAARQAKMDALAMAPVGRLDLLKERERALKLAGDIGPTRAGTFLAELRAIALRVIAYSELLGDERMGNARRTVHEAVLELEGLVDATNSGAVQRFGLIFEELREEAARKGEVL